MTVCACVCVWDIRQVVSDMSDWMARHLMGIPGQECLSELQQALGGSGINPKAKFPKFPSPKSDGNVNPNPKFPNPNPNRASTPRIATHWRR